MISLTAIVIALAVGWATIKAWNWAAAALAPKAPASASLEQGGLS